MDAWFEANPGPHGTVSDVADHIDYVRDVSGIDQLGIGSDFDGAPTMPEGLEDVSRYPTRCSRSWRAVATAKRTYEDRPPERAASHAGRRADRRPVAC